MPKRETHLGAARKHGRVALTELRQMTADSALHWILSHRTRVAQFRRAIKGTSAAKAFDQLLQRIRTQATPLARPPRRKAVRTRRHRRAPLARFLAAAPFPMGG
jgi:hypothetical protein